MRAAQVQAQAKLNLFLRVGPRDASGYHSIVTQFQRIDLADVVVVVVGGTKRHLDDLRSPEFRLGPPEKNLAYRAAVAYAERTGWPSGFSIQLTKSIPVGGGLGGGSADAGAVLRILNTLAPKPVSGPDLLSIAATLGADVPFLTSELVSAVGTGRGEILDPLAPLPQRDVLVVAPSFSVATPDAYRWLDESRPQPTIAPVLPKVIVKAALASWESLPTLSMGGNDFEGPLEKRHPVLGEIRERLTVKGAVLARLAGSGSSVFGVFDDVLPDRKTLADNATVFATRTSSRVVQVEVLE